MDGHEGFYDTTPHIRGRSMSVQQPLQRMPSMQHMQMQPMQMQMQPVQQMPPPAFVQWAPQPLPGLFQIIPVDGAHLGYQPVYQQQQQQQPQQQHHQPPPQQPFYTMPPAAMSPASPAHTFVSPMSPLRRQLSLGMIGTPGSTGGFYQAQPAQPQSQHISPQQRTGMSAPGPTYSSHYNRVGSDSASFHMSPLNGPAPAVMFATPPSERHTTMDRSGGPRDPSMPLPPVTVPRTVPTETRLGQRMQRANRLKPLSLTSTTFGRGGCASHGAVRDPRGSGGRDSAHGSRRLRTNRNIPSITPVGSDREYDAGGSSYSSSPIGSEADTASGSYVFGLRSETSEAGTDGPAGPSNRWSAAPRTMPRIPKYIRGSAAPVAPVAPFRARDVDGPGSPTPRARSFRTPSGNGRSGLLQPGLGCHHEDGGEIERPVRGVEYSSSDEWYTTSDTNPIQRRHRHRLAVDDDARSGRPGLCNCGMQQCLDCGLFISRPESHECMTGG